MTASFSKFLGLTGAVVLSAALAGCGGEFVRDGRSPARLVVSSLTVGDNGTLLSDVVRMLTDPEPCTPESPCPTVFNDVAEVEMRLVLRDQGSATSPASPSALNEITINRYRVTYRRADGRNTPGVDVPYDFDSALTMTVPSGSNASAAFQIVRHSAKEEAPLAALRYTGDIISTIAEVTFYGRDMAGNDVSVSANIGIDFGDFADEND